MHIDVSRTERKREVRVRVNRTHVKAFLDSVRHDSDAMDEPHDAHAMRPHIFGGDEL